MLTLRNIIALATVGEKSAAAVWLRLVMASAQGLDSIIKQCELTTSGPSLSTATALRRRPWLFIPIGMASVETGSDSTDLCFRSPIFRSIIFCSRANLVQLRTCDWGWFRRGHGARSSGLLEAGSLAPQAINNHHNMSVST